MKKRASKTQSTQSRAKQPSPPQPVNVVDGIPDVAEVSTFRRMGMVLLIFTGWAVFLIYCLLAARV